MNNNAQQMPAPAPMPNANANANANAPRVMSLLSTFKQQLEQKRELFAKEKYIEARISMLLKCNESSYAYEAYQDQSSALINRLLNNQALHMHWSNKELAQVNRIIRQAFERSKLNAHRALDAKKLKVLTSFEEKQEEGFDPSFSLASHDAEYLNMPADPKQMIHWVANDDEVRLNSKLDSDFVEFLLAQSTLNRRILILSHATNYSTYAIAQLLNVSEPSISNRKHQLSLKLTHWLKSRR